MADCLDRFNEDYYLRGVEKKLSNYVDYRWLPDLTVPMAAVLCRFLGLRPGETVLDYGCARGYLVKALRQLHVDAWGFDISKWAIENCDAAVRPYVGQTPDLREFYDYVFCKDVLEHIPDEAIAQQLPHLFALTKRAALFIVPLTEKDGGTYIYPGDEQDTTHIHRKTLLSWMSLLQQFAGPEFVVFGSLSLPVLKASIEKYPGSAGFIYCKRFSLRV